jgi:outer membrane protein OmpA-like peptidoglycan-associated protein
MSAAKSILLACTVLSAIGLAQPVMAAQRQTENIIVAQAPPPQSPEEAKRKAEEEKRKGHPPANAPQPPRPSAPQPPHPGAPQPPHPGVEHKPAPPQPPHPAVQNPPVHPQPPAGAPPRPVAPPQPPHPAVQNAPVRPQPPAAAPPRPVAPPPAALAKPAAPPPPPPPPNKPRDASEFIRRNGAGPGPNLNQVRQERRETQEGNRTFIREGDRTIVREGNRAVIHHNEADRFAIGASNVRTEHSGGNTISIVLLPNGVSIVTTTDRDGRLLRRVRRDRDGRDIVLIDNTFAGALLGSYLVDVPPPRVPRDRYIVDAGRVPPDRIYAILVAPPIERLDRRYTLEQVRFNYPLREYMPRVDLDINFDTGSWQLSPGQIGSLAAIADGLNRAIDRNPREVFLIEGHTDAVGTVEDNLSLSDRRAEAVAVALTEQFGVPPENLVTQGYGEEFLKVPTPGPARENRRVAIRRITPLIDR